MRGVPSTSYFFSGSGFVTPVDELRTIGDGWTGTDDTVSAINELIDDSLTDPVVVREARRIVVNVRERDQAAESRAISNYVRSHLRYTRETIETLTSPREMIEWVHRYGKFPEDCDGAVILWAALHKVIGMPVRADVISQRKDRKASHIYAEALVNGRWISDDTIVRGKPYGWMPPSGSYTKKRSYSLSGVSGLGCCSGKNTSLEGDMKFIGRTRVVRSDTFTPKRRRMVGRNVTTRSWRLKPSGMVYCDRYGTLSGVGVSPQMGLDLTAIISTVTKAGETAAKAYESYAKSRIRPFRPRPPTPPPPEPQSSGEKSGGISPTLLLLFAALGYAFLRR